MSSNRLFWTGALGVTGVGAFAIHRALQRQRERVREQKRSVDTRRLHGSWKKLKAVSRKYDPVFAQHAGGLPVPFLRALAKRESNMNANETKGPAWGLMQVVEVVRHDHNKDHGTSYTRQDLLTPTVNVEIATTLLRRIIRSFRHNHPDVANMQPDWSNPRFVELLTFAWNAGWSEVGGMGRVARYLTRRGKAEKVTVQLVQANARKAGAARFLGQRGRMRWSRSVARLFMSESIHQWERDRVIANRSLYKRKDR